MANVEAYGTNIVGSSASGSGGLTQQEHEWLEELYDTRAGMPNINNINSDHTSAAYIGIYKGYVDPFLPISGYGHVELYCPNGGCTGQFRDASNTGIGNTFSVGSSWVSFEVPSDAVYIHFETSSQSTIPKLYFSLLVE